MKLSNREILTAAQALGRLFENKMPVQTSWQIVRMQGKLGELCQQFYRVRDSLLKEFDVKIENDDDGSIRFTSDVEPNVRKFVDELNSLLNIETEVDISPVRLPDTLDVEPSVLIALEKIIEVPNESTHT